MQAYSDPSHAADPHAWPDIEVFEIWPECPDPLKNEDGEPLPNGWYWWPCFPGCLPDGEPSGPFETKEEALQDAQDNYN